MTWAQMILSDKKEKQFTAQRIHSKAEERKQGGWRWRWCLAKEERNLNVQCAHTRTNDVEISQNAAIIKAVLASSGGRGRMK